MKEIKLRDYQDKILNDLKYLPAIGLFMKTGSGKTITSIQRFLKNPTDNLLVICPQSVISQWWENLEDFTKLDVIKYNIKHSVKQKKDYILKKLKVKNAIVVNYDIIAKLDMSEFINNNWTIILDESHKIKNYGTVKKPVKVTEEALKLGERTDYKMLLTATPTEKDNGGYIDYFTQLRFLGYMDYNLTQFKNRYCIEEKIQIPGTPFPIKKIVGYRNDTIEEIRDMIGACCRVKSPKYGDYEPQNIKITLEKPKSYAKMLEQRVYKEITLDNLSSMRIARKTLCSGTVMGSDEYKDRFRYKDNTIKLDWLKEFISNTDEKLIILYNFNVEKDIIIELLEKLGKSYVLINGECNDKAKELKKEFDVVMGQYQAFSEGLDGLQYKTNIMIYYSMPESSQLYKQSLGRIDRDGQVNIPTYYYLLMKDTIDTAIMKKLENKVAFSEKDLNRLEV